ncbi:MAG TPA: DUF47 family protein [Candidatus Marinimicrobia bacterium]|nr:DUF47 family protein [Candidatus Neomarinimicrobiota bacterium]
MSFFKRSKYLENEIDEMLDAISEGIIVFEAGVTSYFDGDMGAFNSKIASIDELESKVDQLRRNIENDLYQHSLIPEHRGDVLGLLESIDEVINTAKETLYQFEVERPFFYKDIVKNFKQLVNCSSKAAESLVIATRAFFRDVRTVKDHLYKVYHYEKEADLISHKLKHRVFQNDKYELAQKMHLRYFALHIDSIADISETVADKLSIYAIKRLI